MIFARGSEVIGKPCYEVFHRFDAPCDTKGMACPLPQVLEGCETVQVLHHCLGSDGARHCHEITMSPLFTPEAPQKRVVEV